MTSRYEGYLAAIHQQEILRNTSSINDTKIPVKKQHVILNPNYVNTTPKMLTISSALVRRCPLGTIY